MSLRRGFTLVEMLVAILLFSVVSLAMVTILATATNLFRLGESGRAASDEAMATLAALDSDLAQAVPGTDGGFWFSQVYMPGRDPAGNMVVALVIRNPDPTAIAKDGANARQLVIWWVDDQGKLHRRAETDPGSKRYERVEQRMGSEPVYRDQASVFGLGCLYLGVDLGGAARTTLLPAGGDAYCTEPIDPGHPDQFQDYPGSVRLTLVFAGGVRDALRGTVVKDDDTKIRVAGLKTLPGGTGAMVRIGDPAAGPGHVEWVGYTTFAKGVLEGPAGVIRGERRTTKLTHARGEPVVTGQSYSLTRVLNH